MNTYKTIEEARLVAEGKKEVAKIIKIEHKTEGTVYICCKVTMRGLENATKKNPESEIKRCIAEYSVRSDEQIRADREVALRDDIKCERCGKHIDGNTAYSQQEWTRFGGQRVQVTAWYCDSCHNVLGAVGAGEHSALADRRNDVMGREMTHKEEWED